MNVFNNFLYPTYVNCRGVSDVVSLYSIFLFLSIFSLVLVSGEKGGLV